MNNKMSELDSYFIKNTEAINKKTGYLLSADSDIRKKRAVEESKKSAVPISKVYELVNDFIEQLRQDNGAKEKMLRKETLVLDNTTQRIIDNGIIATNLSWKSPVWDEEKHRTTKWDEKYDIIKEKFKLEHQYDIVWLKFTNKGHLGVVCKSFDINFDETNSNGKPVTSYKLISEVGESWNNSVVLIFPITKEIRGKRSVGDLELGVGNYLIEKGVPIIDFYSHNA